MCILEVDGQDQHNYASIYSKLATLVFRAFFDAFGSSRRLDGEVVKKSAERGSAQQGDLGLEERVKRLEEFVGVTDGDE